MRTATATRLHEDTRRAAPDSPAIQSRRVSGAGGFEHRAVWLQKGAVNLAASISMPDDPFLGLGYEATAPVKGIAPLRLAALLRDIHTRFSEHRTSSEIARVHGLSAGMLRAFRAGSGRTLHEYITAIRVIHAVRALALTDDKVSAIADSVGYRSKKDLYHALHQHCGVLPKALRARPASERLAFATGIAEQLLKRPHV